MTRFLKLFLPCLLLAAPLLLRAQSQDFEVDYARPREFYVAGVTVEGNTVFSSDQIIQVSGLRKGVKVGVPSDDIADVISRLWAQRYFEDVSIAVDSLTAGRDSAYFKIIVRERPRVSRWDFTGVRTGEKKDLQERLNLRRGGEYSEYIASASSDIIKRFYAEKGFLNAEVTPEVVKDSVVKNAIRVTFKVDRKERVRIKTINFEGADGEISDWKLAKSMKKTKSNKIYNLFSSKKFSEKDYPDDKNGLISAFNEAGYRDARLVKDSIYYVEPGRLGIDLKVDKG
ncbi:MAG: hypothetical protein IKR32_05135, partial [Bacteroidales bacterium]|nr:hypothetical protein [Bacteroidales bacterium]